mmetsp:Transcript_63536/g.170000  ORF Transcript_63536/g.170000 Transcript_63536/m.170000 type:complete len:251 (+) Transcript_63536:219-971(+)
MGNGGFLVRRRRRPRSKGGRKRGREEREGREERSRSREKRVEGEGGRGGEIEGEESWRVGEGGGEGESAVGLGCSDAEGVLRGLGRVGLLRAHLRLARLLEDLAHLDERVGQGLHAPPVPVHGRHHDLAHAAHALLQQQLAHLPHHVEPRPHHLGLHLPLLHLVARPLIADLLRHVGGADGVHEHRRAARRNVRALLDLGEEALDAKEPPCKLLALLAIHVSDHAEQLHAARRVAQLLGLLLPPFHQARA